jgi:manganese transport protein
VSELKRGFPLVQVRDAAAVETERSFLREVNARPRFWRRWAGYWTFTGPGWVQSALTLGAGSAGSTILAASLYGYDLLWVQPVAMFLSVMMFGAIGHQALSTGARPFDVFVKKLHPALAYLWGFSVLVASIVFQFPQYSLGTSVVRDMFAVAGVDIGRLPVALALLAGGTAVCWSYGRSRRGGVRAFERVLKYLLLLMILAFALVVVKTGIDLRAAVRGLFGFRIPAGKEGLTIVLGMLGAAAGVNMTFLYPYTLLARGWGKDHRRLKNFDLGVTMFLPFVLATGLVTIACANTLHAQGLQVRDAVDAAHALAPVVGLTVGRVVFSLGVLGMCFTTLVIEMLICGLVLSEMFGFELHGRSYKAATMLANVGLLGAFAKLPFWIPVVASSFSLLMMPVTYVCFLLLQTKRCYLGQEAVRSGAKAWVWNGLLIAAVLAVAAGAAAKLFL